MFSRRLDEFADLSLSPPPPVALPPAETGRHQPPAPHLRFDRLHPGRPRRGRRRSGSAPSWPGGSSTPRRWAMDPGLGRHPRSPRDGAACGGHRPGRRPRFAAWVEGRTGYWIVDAGMRQLPGEAWMHNRVRMVTASFLLKDLHLDSRRGAPSPWPPAVADLASNQHRWQWVAGTGTDPAPRPGLRTRGPGREVRPRRRRRAPLDPRAERCRPGPRPPRGCCRASRPRLPATDRRPRRPAP